MRCHEAIPDLPSSPWEPKRHFKNIVRRYIVGKQITSHVMNISNTEHLVIYFAEFFSLLSQKQKVICGTPLNRQCLFSK